MTADINLTLVINLIELQQVEEIKKFPVLLLLLKFDVMLLEAMER